MSEKTRKLKNRRMFPIIGVIALTLTLGIGIGAILFSNRLTQTLILTSESEQFDLTVEAPLETVTFKGDTVTTSIRITRVNPQFESNWRVTIQIENIDTGDLLATQVIGNSQFFELDHTTEIVAYTPAAFVNNGTNIYAHISSMPSWSAYVTQGDYCFVDLDLTFNNGASSGTLEISVIITDFV